MSSNLFRNKDTNKLFTNKLYIYIYKQNLELNDHQGLPLNQIT